jgi:hypothetical protein
VNTLALARNARTSQQMIDRFYAAHLTTEHVRKQLHGFIDKTPIKKAVKAVTAAKAVTKAAEKVDPMNINPAESKQQTKSVTLKNSKAKKRARTRSTSISMNG